MKRNVLLDANMLIGAFDHDPANAEHVRARAELRALLSDPDVTLAITPLVSFEVLRKPTRTGPAELESRLDTFRNFPVSGAEARRAAEVFRLFSTARGKPERRNLEKLSMDIFYCACLELNHLEPRSRDGDIPGILQLMRENPITIQSSKQNV
ncbi:MAG: PIN domain-containing protein [Candidatus Accumulibacter sp.]|jgi:predicted nucleic acid-binding protein|nr:PIN domain-containing protein [Accumulibacter sp.]